MKKETIKRMKLFTENERYVTIVAKQYMNRGLSLEQLIEEGNKGLLYAVCHYRSNKDCFFTKHAMWLVRLSILQALAAMESGDIIPPVYVPKKSTSAN